MNNSSNKLAYLSKYLGDEKPKKEKKSKKEKRSKKRRDENTKIQDADQADDLAPIPQDDHEEDNSDDDGPVIVQSSKELTTSFPKGQWEAVGEGSNTKNACAAEENEKPRRRRHDSSSDEEERKILEPSNQERQDVVSAPGSMHALESTKKRRRYDSSSSDDDKNGHRHDSSSSSEESSDDERERMSSGHIAGLQSGSKFSKTEKKLQNVKQEEVRTMAEKYGHGDTIYREKTTGRKVEKNQTDKGQADLTQALLNTSQAQRERELQRKEEITALQQASFARHADDERLEFLRKNEIREGDPMAAFASKKKGTKGRKERSDDISIRPVYKGPPPKPNRFNIRPGFRWDGVDRGNGFEDKLLSKRNLIQHQKEVAYRWSTADM